MLTNKQIFNNAIFDLPKKREGKDFQVFLKDNLVQFKQEISKFRGELRDSLKLEIPFINEQIKFILASLNNYYQGFPAAAYDNIKNALDALDSKNILPIQNLPIINDRNNFYRIRVSDNRSLAKSDLFHIPFESREKVTTQRYSIPGLPCLYLGDSMFVCWEELNRPDFDRIHVSRFDLSQANFNFLYFNVSVNEIRKKCFVKKNDEGKFLKSLISFLCYYPLFLACSIIVDKPQDIFKPEYIIPQLVLQCIARTNKIDGVVYKSNRINISNHNFGTFSNIVIPVKRVVEKGFCDELKSKIKLTNPVSWQLLDIANTGKQNIAIKDIQVKELRHAMYIELINGEKSFYQNTKFGIIEAKLKEMATTYL